MTTVAERDAFPLNPPDGVLRPSDEAPSGPDTRPWALRGARVPDSTTGTRVPEHFYDRRQQINLTPDGDTLVPLAAKTASHDATVSDGDIKNPPPLDEGPKDA
jgi:putative ATP-grasp target RiPP